MNERRWQTFQLIHTPVLTPYLRKSEEAPKLASSGFWQTFVSSIATARRLRRLPSRELFLGWEPILITDHAISVCAYAPPRSWFVSLVLV